VTEVTQEHLSEIVHSTKNQALKTSKQVDSAVKKANQTVEGGRMPCGPITVFNQLALEQ
jgi:hypothetical protein